MDTIASAHMSGNYEDLFKKLQPCECDVVVIPKLFNKVFKSHGRYSILSHIDFELEMFIMFLVLKTIGCLIKNHNYNVNYF